MSSIPRLSIKQTRCQECQRIVAMNPLKGYILAVHSYKDSTKVCTRSLKPHYNVVFNTTRTDFWMLPED